MALGVSSEETAAQQRSFAQEPQVLPGNSENDFLVDLLPAHSAMLYPTNAPVSLGQQVGQRSVPGGAWAGVLCLSFQATAVLCRGVGVEAATERTDR